MELNRRPVASLWIGEKLQYLNQLCLKSHVLNGHPTTLYCTDNVTNAPEGVEIRPATEIMDIDMSVVEQTSASFLSNVFRYKMIQKTGAVWIDCDAFCHKPFPDEWDHIYAGHGMRDALNCGVVGIPQQGDLMDGLLDYYESLPDYPEWWSRHQRKKILETLMGYDPDYEIDVRVPDRELSIDEVRELNVRLNKNMGEWNFDTLANNFELDDLKEWGFEDSELDLDLWTDVQLDDPGAQIDHAEELREKWGVETGQLWRLGEHRLICGDCTDASVIKRVMGGEKAKLLVTDPPYNLGFDYGENVNDNQAIGEYKKFLWSFFEVWRGVSEKQIITPGKQNLYLWDEIEYTDLGCWYKKNAMSGSKIAYLNLWEPVLFFGKFDRKSRSSDIFDYNVAQQKGVGGHPCPKILELWQDFIEHYSDQGEFIADCFDGSGTTLIACERLNRKCRAVEISPAYCAVAIQRWVDMTGGEPVKLEDIGNGNK